MESSNPLVVTKATRAPLRCRSVLVPTVVPCSTTISWASAAILLTASAMACAGSAGVENTFRMRRVEPCNQTQSVKVPPLSMAILRGAPAALAATEDFWDRVVTLVVLSWAERAGNVRANTTGLEDPKDAMLPDSCRASCPRPSQSRFLLRRGDCYSDVAASAFG